MVSSRFRSKGKRPVRKIILWSSLIVFVCFSVYAYVNFNQILANALLKSFNSNAFSDVYELKFDKLRVNFIQGNITVKNVVIQQRQVPLHNYPYINSSFRLTTGEMRLRNVQLLTLIKSGKLTLLRIEILKPDIQVRLTAENNIMLPFADSTAADSSGIKDLKRFVDSYFLSEFRLVNASFHLINSWKHREFTVDKLNMSLNDLMLTQQPGRDLLSFKKVSLRIGEVSGQLQKEAIKNVRLREYRLTIESLNIQKSLDTLIYHFDNFNTGMKDLDILTKDSIFQITAQSVELSYLGKSLKLTNLSFKPNINRASLQKRYDFQTPQFSGTIGTLNMLNISFDSLIYHKKLFVDKIDLARVDASVFKDKRKPLDAKRFPVYPGQLISSIPIPLLIKHIKATGVNVVNNELKPDESRARITIQDGTLEVENFTNLPTDKLLTLNAEATVEKTAHFSLKLEFDYLVPQFSFSGIVGNFNMPDLNQFLQSYLPATIKKGISDGISFSGNAYKTNATGEMTFLFHDLDIDLQLKEKTKLQNSIFTFAANTFLINRNPAKAGQPPRVVKFNADRDINKGFINIILKAFFSGMKETMVLSKENRKIFHEAKKEDNLQEYSHFFKDQSRFDVMVQFSEFTGNRL
jgi:hypothetical protein